MHNGAASMHGFMRFVCTIRAVLTLVFMRNIQFRIPLLFFYRIVMALTGRRSHANAEIAAIIMAG